MEIKNYKNYQNSHDLLPAELCRELFFCVCEKALLSHFRQLSLYTAITRVSAAENYLRIVAFLNKYSRNEQ